ncbi:MAG: hypothetical protein D6690_13955 [Nitrospirae bacterium]|nr:MAG: hypothetical protein D6690_13955 [Nitrospirota bacterium]
MRHPWPALIAQAEARGLPTGFLKEIAPDFVDVAFEDLRTYAAEYHPERHQMILNLRLSFNEAGGALADLTRMTHHDLGLLYHELLHAYLDYLFSASDPTALSPRARRALALATAQLHCHYRFVRINPIRQRRTATELRFLSDEDAWEVLNETWAVFVGWAIWTKLELFHGQPREGTWTPELLHEWRSRLEAAHRSGELLGYYEPDDPEERRIARKRFIAPTNALTPQEAEFLLREILEEPRELADIAKAVLAQKVTDESTPSCQ